MANQRKLDAVFNVAASIATILSVMFSIYTTLLPNQVNAITGRFLGPIDTSSSGLIRPEFVASQKWLFLSVWALISLFMGMGLAGWYRWTSAMNARAIAADRESKSWFNALFLLFAVACILSGIGLPRAIFQPTNEVELAKQFLPAAWALRSWLGGLVLGLFILLTSLLAAFLFFWVGVTLPRSVTAKKFQRIMENG
ncbi:MAG: hypothetical protein WAM82_22920 [Thermoanaerobaculia bacterium]